VEEEVVDSDEVPDAARSSRKINTISFRILLSSKSGSEALTGTHTGLPLTGADAHVHTPDS
jgi:hypothetical protein